MCDRMNWMQKWLLWLSMSSVAKTIWKTRFWKSWIQMILWMSCWKRRHVLKKRKVLWVLRKQSSYDVSMIWIWMMSSMMIWWRHTKMDCMKSMSRLQWLTIIYIRMSLRYRMRRVKICLSKCTSESLMRWLITLMIWRMLTRRCWWIY